MSKNNPMEWAITQMELESIETLVSNHQPVPAELVNKLLKEYDIWVRRAFGDADHGQLP